MTLWEQAEAARQLELAELRDVVTQCQDRIEQGRAVAEDYMRYIACKLELTQRQSSQQSPG